MCDAFSVLSHGAARPSLTSYVVGWDPSMFDELARGIAAAGAQRPHPNPALTLIGVASLFTPEMLIEIEAAAVAH